MRCSILAKIYLGIASGGGTIYGIKNWINDVSDPYYKDTIIFHSLWLPVCVFTGNLAGLTWPIALPLFAYKKYAFDKN